MAQNGSENGAYQLITPPNLLKAKVSAGDGGGIDPDLIKQAESVIDSMSGEFAESVGHEIARLMKLALDLEEDMAQAEKVMKKVRSVGHELRGQGATYDYPLISDVAASLFRYTERLYSHVELSADVLRAHADAMRAVIKNDVRGDGGAVGADLVQSLEALVDRMSG